MMRILVPLLLTLTLAGRRPEGGWPTPPDKGRIVKVYDGDTFTLEGGDKIRLRWVNTPELKPAEPYGGEAKQLATDLLLDRVATLKVGPEERDGYGRIIAGVLTDRGEDVSLKLLEYGYAHVFIIPPDDRDPTKLLEAQAKARKERRGIWSTESYQGAMHMTSFHANAAGDDYAKPEGEYLRIANVSSEPVDLGGWRMTNLARQEYRLPSVIVPPGHTVQVRSGRGPEQADPLQQLEVFLGSDGPVWNDDYDVAELMDPEGRVVDRRTAGKR